MRVFDFDNTIYDGESVLDFYFFSIKYKPVVIKYIFVVLYEFLRYKWGLTTLSRLDEVASKYATEYANEFDDIDKVVNDFWDKNIKKIKPWYTPQPDDLLLTASFNIIMDELCRRTGIKRCICSIFNREDNSVTYLNFSGNKKETFQKKYGEDTIIDKFYTDHKFDKPMFSISKEVYLVKGNKIKKIK